MRGGRSFASSRRAWLDLKRALADELDAKYAGWDADADQAAARLAPKVARLRLDLRVAGPRGDVPPQEAKGLRVIVNGEAVDPALVGTELDRDPGVFAVHAEADGADAPVEGKVEIPAGEARTLTLKLTVRAPVSDAPPPAAERGGSSVGRTLGWVGVGVGGALVVGSVVSLVVRQGALADLEAGCPGYATGPCPRAVESDVSRGEVASVLFPVLGLTGLAAAGTGVALLVTSRERPAAPGHAARSVGLRPTLGGLVCEGSF